MAEMQIEMGRSRTEQHMVAKGWMRILSLEGKVLESFDSEIIKLQAQMVRYRVENDANVKQGLYVKRDDYGLACYVLELFSK